MLWFYLVTHSESDPFQCIFLFSRYKPPRLWGFSGHFQAIVENFLTELFSPTSSGERIFLKASGKS